METIKKYLIAYGYTLAIIAIACLLLTILNYFDVINGNIFKWIKLIISIIALLISSFKIGKKANKQGYLEGLKFGGIFSLLVLLFSVNSLNINTIIYILIILIASMLGAMLGITKKEDKES